MKCPVFLMFFLIQIALISNAQQKIFPKATYEITKTFCNSKFHDNIEDKYIKYTVLDMFVKSLGKVYQPIIFSLDKYSEGDDGMVFYIRQDSNKVYIMHEDFDDICKEELFVDFSNQIGDTIRFADHFWGDCRFTLIDKRFNWITETFDSTYKVDHLDFSFIDLIPKIVQFSINSEYGIIDIYTNYDGKALKINGFCVTSYFPLLPRLKYRY